MSIARSVRLVAALGTIVMTAGCSSDITRFSQPFFSSGADATGSLQPVPSENVLLPGASGSAVTPIQTAIDAPSSVNPSAIESANIPSAAGDGFSVVRAEAGDTVYSLSRRYGVSARAIMAANEMTGTQNLRKGQNVRIPPVSWRPGSPITTGAASQPTRRTPVTRVAAKQGERVHVVRSGDTLFSIARQYSMRASDLSRHNGLESPDRLRVGQNLKIPASAPVQVAKASNFANDASPPVRAAAPRKISSLQPLPTPRPSARQTRAASASPKDVRSVAAGPLPKPKAMAAGKFRWPVRGRVISQFGALPSGVQNDGINVAVPEGTSVKAAQNGVVAYVGNELKGYGNLILVRHDNDWVSAYAHNSKTLVIKGEQVRRGQIIAKAGQSGAVPQPQLHFELRKGSRPVDPIPYLDGTT